VKVAKSGNEASQRDEIPALLAGAEKSPALPLQGAFLEDPPPRKKIQYGFLWMPQEKGQKAWTCTHKPSQSRQTFLTSSQKNSPLALI